MNGEIDAGIVGAGPAGARAGELLAGQGLRVVLFDPRAPWEKPCGGGLTAAAFEKVPELVEVVPFARRIGRVRLEAGTSRLGVDLDEPLHVVSRKALGRWQLDRARAAGAALESVAVRRIARHEDGGWHLGLADGRSVRCRLLVGADGAASLVRKTVAPDLPVELAPARVAFAPGAGATPEAIGLRFYRRVAGYAWDFPRRAHRSIGVGVTPGSWQRRRMDREIDRYWDELGRCSCVEAERAGAVIGTARGLRPAHYAAMGGADFALLGDAAGLADPATGEGILNALCSAEMLAETYAMDGTFARYPDMVVKRLEPEFRIARNVRRFLYGGSLAHRLIRLARRSGPARALLVAIVNGGNEHDPRLVWRMWHTWRSGRRAPRAGPGMAASGGAEASSGTGCATSAEVSSTSCPGGAGCGCGTDGAMPEAAWETRVGGALVLTSS